MHLVLEFRAGDARGASSVPWLHRECPHSWVWPEAIVPAGLMASPALLLPSLPDLLVPQG